MTKSFAEEPIQLQARNWRQRGDQLRDMRQWREAANAYETYLASAAADFAIWVQLGNCLKEAGDADAAQNAYASAIKLNPNDAEAYLQMGHLMKIQDRRDRAIKYYQKSHELDPESGAAVLQLKTLGVKTKGATSPLDKPALAGQPALILDVTDLIIFLTENSHLTGIQRVQVGVAEQLLNCFDKLAVDDTRFSKESILVSFCDPGAQICYAIPGASFNSLINLAKSGATSRGELDDQLARLKASSVAIQPRALDTYVVLGAYWIGHDYTRLLSVIKSSGCKLGVFVHDLIPLTHPQFVAETTRLGVLDQLGDVLSLADFVLSSSEYVIRETQSILQSELHRPLPVFAVPLAHALSLSPDDEAEAEPDFIAALPQEYVLCVGTIEARKNHLLLLNIWATLKRKHDGRIPHLVIVGKWGWRVEEFRSKLEDLRYVDGKIIVLNNLSDAALRHLYQNCLFTVFPSFVEGWGLPVGESLAYGKPCIASSSSSIPEVGGDLCRYINPYDPMTAGAEIERAILDRDGLRQWTQSVARDFKLRGWSAVAKEFIAKVEAAVAQSEGGRPRAAEDLAPGRIHKIVRRRPGAVSWRESAVKFICAQGWWPVEDWGAWSSRRRAKIEFGTSLPPASRIRVLLNLRLPPMHGHHFLTIRDFAGNSKRVGFSSPDPKWAHFDSEVDAKGLVKLECERLGQVEKIDPTREIYCGISAIAYHEKNDLASRIEIMERLFLFENE